MTIEQLLERSADELEKMSDAELKEIFKPFEHITRPELASKPEPNKPKKAGYSLAVMSEKDKKRQKAMEIAKQMGIDLKY